MDEKNVSWLNFGVQFNVILPAAPHVTGVGQQIVYLILVRRHLSKFSNRHMDKRTLLAKWIEIYRHKDDVVPGWGHLAIEQNRVVIGGGKKENLCTIERR